MHLRKLLLRIMIWSLGAAAVLGAVAILTNGSDVIWRIAGTTGITAMCAAAMMAASLLLEREKSRESGLVGMAAACVSAFLSLLLIWDLDFFIPTARPEQTCGMTIANVLICALPAMVFLRGRHITQVQIASQIGVILTIVTFGLYLIPSWFVHTLFGIGSSDDWLFTATATGLIGLLATACAVSIDDLGKRGAMGFVVISRIAGLAASLFAWCVALYGIWAHVDDGSGAMTAAISVACVVGLANLALLVPLSAGQSWIRTGTLSAAALAALCVDILALSDWSDPNETMTRVGGAAGFVSACGSLALIILVRVNRPMAAANRAYREATELIITCPGCRSKQKLPVGGSSCPTCHLRFNIQIDEPRCPQCDYLLFMLTSDKCPECGTPINQNASMHPGADRAATIA